MCVRLFDWLDVCSSITLKRLIGFPWNFVWLCPGITNSTHFIPFLITLTIIILTLDKSWDPCVRSGMWLNTRLVSFRAHLIIAFFLPLFSYFWHHSLFLWHYWQFATYSLYLGVFSTSVFTMLLSNGVATSSTKHSFSLSIFWSYLLFF